MCDDAARATVPMLKHRPKVLSDMSRQLTCLAAFQCDQLDRTTKRITSATAHTRPSPIPPPNPYEPTFPVRYTTRQALLLLRPTQRSPSLNADQQSNKAQQTRHTWHNEPTWPCPPAPTCLAITADEPANKSAYI